MNPTFLLSTTLALGILSACGKKKDTSAPPPAAATASQKPAPAAVPIPAFEKLNGKWLRPDGGYILELRNASAQGKLEAAYFNPRPIHVARAEWRQKDGKLQLFVELRDVNYPGSTYTLDYSAADDRMTGNYFQALQGQNFDVEFIRQK